MIWTKLHLRKPVSFTILYTVILALGILALPNVRFNQTTEAAEPIISIKTQYFGMDSRYIEERITTPIENALSSLKGIGNIASVSEDGQSIVTVKLNPDRGVRIATLEIKSAVDTVVQSFPSDVQEPVISHYDPSQAPIMILSFFPEKNDMSLIEVRRIVEREVKPLIEKADGAAECIVTGGKQEEIGVFADAGVLAARGLQYRDINLAVQRNNNNILAGYTVNGGKNKPVEINGNYNSYPEIGFAPVYASVSNNRSSWKVSDVAEVKSHYRRVDSIARIDGYERVTLYIQKKSGANTLALCRQINRIMQDFKADGLKWEADFDKSQEISKSLNNMILSIVIGIILLILITLLFIPDFRQSLLTIIPIPLSLAMVFFAAWAGKVEFDGMMLSGIALGSGLLVNNGLIIVQFLSMSRAESKPGVIMREIKKLLPALTASLMTTISVFLPVLFLSRNIREAYGGFSLVILVLLIAAYFLSLGILPLLYRYFPKKSHNGYEPELFKKNRISGFFEREYIRLMIFLKPRKGRVIGIFFGVMIFSSLFFMTRGRESSAAGYTQELTAYVEPASGTSLEETDRLTKGAEELLAGRKEIQKIITKVENAQGTILIRLKKSIRDKEAGKLMDSYRKLFERAECFVYVTGASGQSAGHDMDIMIVGDSPDKIRKYCREASQILNSLPIFSDVVLRFKDDSPLYIIKPDKVKIGLSGLSLSEVADEARTYLYGVISTKLSPEGKGMMDIRVASPPVSGKESPDLEDFLKLSIMGNQENPVSIGELVSTEKGSTASRIYHYNKRRTYSITATLKPGIALNRGYTAVTGALNRMRLPEGYYWQFDEQLEELNRTIGEMVLAVILAVYLTYVTLVTVSEEIRKSAVALLAIPMALPGSALGLFLFGQNLSVPVFMGWMLLAGATVTHSVLLLSGLNSKSGWKEILRSVKSKISTIVLTTLTAVSGILPLMFSAGADSPFAVTVVFGLLFSTLGIVIILPLVLEKRVDDR